MKAVFWMDDKEASALDKLLGADPHFALLTVYGIFCPGCSNFSKASFVAADMCNLAVLTVPRVSGSNQGPGSLFLEAGLKHVQSGELETMRTDHLSRRKALGGSDAILWSI